MNLFYLVAILGGALGLLAIVIAVLVERAVNRRKLAEGAQYIPRDHSIGRLNPGALMSTWGADATPHHSLDTVTMRPTIGIKVFGGIIVGLMIYIMSGESGEIYRQDGITVLLASGCIGYYVLFLMFYEVRYDGETLKAPGIFFIPKSYDWSDFVSIRQTDQVTYTLIFTSGQIKVRKFLAGMPTFLTFVTEVREMNNRL